MVRLKYLLLPIAGALSAFLSFLLAAPYIKTLNRPWLKADDPVSHFTYGTLWTNVQHAAFGILLCGSFCFILEAGRRSWPKVLQATILGMIIGGIANSCADSGADYIGISCMRTMGASGQFIGAMAWFILVPAALAFSITLAIGPTKQRVARAIYAIVVAAPITFVGRIVGSIAGAAMMMSTMNMGDIASGNVTTSMEKSVPAWLIEAVFAGIALGLTMMIADRVSRKGSLRLVYGRKEFKDWSLDHTANRIGSSEVEIPIRGFKGVEPVHACIFRQGNQFILDSQHAPGFVNGYPVTQANLNHGDVIQLGEAQLVFYSSGAVRSQPNRMQVPLVPIGAGVGPGQAVPIHPAAMQPTTQGQYAGAMPVAQPFPGQFPVAPQQAPNPIAPAAVASVPQYALIDLAGKTYPLHPGVNSIGREVGNTVCFSTNSTVSRAHAQISIDNTGVSVSDLGSANGTGVNGVAVNGSTSLQDGDAIEFGSAKLTFRITTTS